MIGIDSVVYFVLFILGAGLVFGLLNYLIDYVSREFPSTAPFARFAKVSLVVFAVLFAIGIVLNFMGFPMIKVR
jgi:hypothetical protein